MSLKNWTVRTESIKGSLGGYGGYLLDLDHPNHEHTEAIHRIGGDRFPHMAAAAAAYHAKQQAKRQGGATTKGGNVVRSDAAQRLQADNEAVGANTERCCAGYG